MKLRLVVGLGNPSKKYDKTRHNVGFMVLDALAKELGANFEFKKKFNSEIATPHFPKLVLVKPQTFMNQSGQAAGAIAKTYKQTPHSFLIVHDEIDLPLGKIKFGSGSSAGHKGVASIIAALGQNLTRLRIGIENRQQYRIPPTDDYVLQKFTKIEMKRLKEAVIPRALDEIKKWVA